MNVLITREKDKYQVFADKLSAVGMTPFSLPMIDCVPVRAIISGHYDYGVFTSLNSAKYFRPYVDKVSFDRVVSVGTATAEALLTTGLKTDIIPDEYSAEGLKAAFEDIDVEGKRFLFAGARVRAGDFDEYLKDRGAIVDLITIYTTEPVHYPQQFIENFLKENEINIVTFASPSAARAMLESIDGMTQQIVCIGKTTSDEVRRLGYDSRHPKDFTLDWMVKLINELS
jgi:uroporphyrinogen-III synthase